MLVSHWNRCCSTGEEIVDETDAFLDGTHTVPLDRADAFKFARLRLLDSKIVDEKLSLDETRAVTAHLLKNFEDVVSLLTEAQLQRLIADTPVTVLPTATQQVGQDLPTDLLYAKAAPSDTCTLILSGKVSVLVGLDGFRSDVSSWSLLASGAMGDVNYKPDFTAFVSSGPCRCIRITRERFSAAVDASAAERTLPSSTTSRPVVSEDGPTDDSPTDTSLDRSESSRKSKLITALRAVEGQPNGADLNGSVHFAEPGSLESSRSAPPPKTTTTPPSPSKAAAPAEAVSQFEFIASPGGKAATP